MTASPTQKITMVSTIAPQSRRKRLGGAFRLPYPLPSRQPLNSLYHNFHYFTILYFLGTIVP